MLLVKATGLQFTYDPAVSRVSARQVTCLLEGFGYDQVTCVHDQESGLTGVCGHKFGQASLDENEHEVSAICNVIGQWVEIDYFKLKAVEKLTYTRAGEAKFKKLKD